MPSVAEYTVQEGDTIQDIATRFYGLPSEYPIIVDANPSIYLQNLEVFPGQVLIIPELVEIITEEPEEDDGSNAVVIDIDGINYTSPLSFSLTRTIDLAADAFSFLIPWDPSNTQLRETFIPFKYRKTKIFIGGILKFTGVTVNAIPDTKSDKRTLKVSGYSTCGVLNDCNLPVNAPHTFTGSTLLEICNLVARPFNVFVRDKVGDQSTFDEEIEEEGGGFISTVTDFFVGQPTTKPFEETEIKNTDKAYKFLAGLAKKKGVLLSSDKHGHLVLQQATSQKAKFTFEEGGSQIVEIKANLKGQNGFTSFWPILKGADTLEEGGDDSIEIKDPFLEGVSTRPLVFEVDEIEEGDLQAAGEAKMRRSWAARISYNVIFKDWRDPDGKVWEENQRINIKYPGVMIYNTTEFLIKSVDLEKDADKDVTKMTIVLPQSYNSEPLEQLPW